MNPVADPRRPLTSRAGVMVALAAALFAIVCTTLATAPAQAADLREFSAGNIITDQVFFDEGSMAPGAVQAFLDDKGSACVRGADGTACMRAYRMDTSSRSATTYCPGGYQGASQETAATIIYKVAQACRVNPQVLLVMLQKEMGLVRTTNPTAKMYSRAMGYGCPDNSTGVCDSAYYGLYNQLYSAASQFQRYVKNPTNYSYRAGITNYILYHPYNNCGRQAVYIQNGATAALYNYTPYVPNSAALNAGYGTGDGCSSYGNRNFFSYFTDWFGSTQSTGSGAVNLKYMALGGASSSLGLPVAATQCDLAAGGCARAYAGGSIYWSPSSGAAVVTGEVRTGWWANGGITGPMGYPIADSGPITGGAAGAFQGGSVYWSAGTGAHAVDNELLPNWWSTGGVSGSLGWPVASTGAVTGGKAGAFQGGSIYWSAATGAHWLNGEVRNRYWAMGSNTSELGFPTSDLGPAGAGQAAAFTGGSIYWSAGTGAHAVAKELASELVGHRWDHRLPRLADRRHGHGARWQVGHLPGRHDLLVAVLRRALADRRDPRPLPGGERRRGGARVPDRRPGGRPGRRGRRVPERLGVLVGRDRCAHRARRGPVGVVGSGRSDRPARIPHDRHRIGGRSPAARRGRSARSAAAPSTPRSPPGPALLSGNVLAAYVAAGGPEEIGFPIADQSPVTGGTAAAFQDAIHLRLAGHRRARGARPGPVGLVGSWRDHRPARLPDHRHRLGGRPRRRDGAGAAPSAVAPSTGRRRPAHGWCPGTCSPPTWPRAGPGRSASRLPTRGRSPAERPRRSRTGRSTPRRAPAPTWCAVRCARRGGVVAGSPARSASRPRTPRWPPA